MQRIRDVMTPAPVTVPSRSSLVDAARAMRVHGVGAVIVLEEGQVRGIVTDRDIAVRGVAEGLHPAHVAVGEVCSSDLVVLGPDDSVDDAVRLMRERALRRLPVVDDGRAVGIVSLGDLAIERDPDSALADISAAPPNE